jgi:Bacterial pre-peptidase C-terminal domain
MKPLLRGIGLPLCVLCVLCSEASANPPVASYLFPAGGQRGTTVKVRVGGLFLYNHCGFEMLGPGVQAPARIERMPPLFFEGPLLPLPDSQQAEDYPRDLGATIRIAPDAPLGVRRARVWTAEGAASGLQFVVGDLPEIVEEEIEGDPVAVPVKLPVTINGRIFPRQNVDLWEFTARKGQSITCEVNAARLGSPLEAALAVLDRNGRVLAENGDGLGIDPLVRFTAPADGAYRVRIHDANNKGGPAHVYRLTLTTDPYVDRVYPLGGRRGERVRLTLHGQGVPETPLEVALPPNAPRDYLHRPTLSGKPANEVLLDVDDLPEVIRPDSTPADKAQVVTVPAMLNGRILKPGQVDRWECTVRKGDSLALELRAAQLGSPLQGVLTIGDSQGKQLGRAEGTPTQVDPVLAFLAPTDGTYTIQVADRFRTRGGPAFAYRLRLAPPPMPDFRLHLGADTVTIPRGGKAPLKIQVERLNWFAGPINLTFDGLPAGVKAAVAVIPAGQHSVDVPFSAEAAAAISAGRVTVRGTAMVGEKTKVESVTRTATLPAPRGQLETDSVLVAVALPAPFKVVSEYEMRIAPRGSVLRRRYRIERKGYEGPFEVCLADRQARHLQGANGPTLTVPAGVSEFEYPITLPPWMETGRTCRVCIMTMATIKDGAAEHQVSYSAVGQNDQIITVVETGRLSLETEKTSVLVRPGQSVQVPLQIARGKGLAGAVKVELILGGHIRGVKTDPVTISADQGNGQLTIRFDRDGLGPFNRPALIRATLMDGSGPVIAEASLELVTEEP